MLTDVKLPGCYFTATSAQLLEELYVPSLSESSLYQRGVAYFSIQFLLGLMDGVVSFVQRGGVIHLVTSVELDQSTVESFARGYLLTEDSIETRLSESIQAYRNLPNGVSTLDEAKLDVIANMIAARHLVIKVAYVPTGIYHEKIGLFTDAQGNSISFIGSANATVNAYQHNFETVNVFASWESPQVVAGHREHFARLWNNDIKRIVVVPFPEAVEKQFIDVYRISSDLRSAISRLINLSNPELKTGPSPQAQQTIRDYQANAITQFVENGYRHFFEMATGTGKTFTAIKAMERMAEACKILNVVVLVPLKDLQRQWVDAIERTMECDHQTFRFGGGGHDNITDFNLSAITGGYVSRKFISVGVCVYDTFFAHIVSEISPVGGDVLLVVDEAHNLTSGQLSKLKSFARFRLGLSATPERHNPKETEAILGYFLADGVTSFKFGLKEAIEQEYLSPYEYYPIPVTLTDDESVEYQKLTKSIGMAQAIYDQEPSRENRKRLDDLKMARSRIVKKAINKLTLLKAMVDSGEYDFSNSVVFAGPGCVDLGDGEGQQKLLDLVTSIVSRSAVRKYYPAKYTSAEEDRPERLENFREGLTDTLVAIRCFDEGLDVPALDKIYLMASDSSRRQTIQRRGRVLRVSKDTGKQKARIYDMVAGVGEGYMFVPLQTECPRVAEYAGLSLNPEASEGILRYFDQDDRETLDDGLFEE